MQLVSIPKQTSHNHCMSLQFVCNQGNHSVVETTTLFFALQEVSGMLITCGNEASLAFPALVLKSNFLDHLFNSVFS